MSIELFLKRINDNIIKPALENYIMFSMDEMPDLIKKLQAGEKITITRSNSDTNKYLENQIYVSDIGFFLKVTNVQETGNSDIPTEGNNKNNHINQLVNSYNDMNIITLEPYTKIAQDDKYKSISIKDELTKAKNIWISSDYHLMLYSDKSGISDNSLSEKIITNQNECVSDDDIFIYLGDLVDGEISNKESIKYIIKRLKGKKILVKGNNDVLPDEFYEECGFMAVFDSFKYNNIIFSHPPLHKSQFNGAEYNIHGHIHGYRSYVVPYCNHIDAYFKLHEKVPTTIDSLIEKCKDGYYKPSK